MRAFDYMFLRKKAWDIEIVNYLSQIHELKGKQTVYLRQKPDVLEKLVEIAKIQSTESSNAIEGIQCDRRHPHNGNAPPSVDAGENDAEKPR